MPAGTPLVYAARRLMRLLIIRHAIAVPAGQAGVPDGERPLTGRGRRRFRRAARGLARIADPPDVLLTSPLRRAVQTARIAARAWGGIEPVEEPSLAGADLDAVLAAVMHASEVAGAPAGLVAVVGHEPSTSSLLARLIGGSRPERLEFRRGGAALVELPGPAGEGGRLVWYLQPRVLRALGED